MANFIFDRSLEDFIATIVQMGSVHDVDGMGLV